MYSVVADEVLENVAPNKSSRQFNTYSASYSSDNGNDGNFSTCVRSAIIRSGWWWSEPRITNPWWAVDLGSATSVYQVKLTNAGSGILVFSLSIAI